MSGHIQDGTWTSPQQDGAKRLSFPWQDSGDFYATETRRNYSALAPYYDTILETRTSYTNLLTYSDDLSNAAWTKTNTTATSGQTDLEGGTSASKIAEDTTNGAHSANRALTAASGALSFGAILKAGERSFARLRIYNATDGDVVKAVFDLTNGTVLSGSGTIKKLPKGWFWCFVGGAATIANSSVYIEVSSDGTTWSYAGTTGSGIYAFRATAILSIPSVPWPAIATTAATRAISAPPVDADDPLSFLVEETEPGDGDLLFGVAKWGRLYSRIPKQQTVPAGNLFSTPNFPTCEWISGINFLSLNVWQLVGDYGVWMLRDYNQNSSAKFGPLVGYYGAEVAITGYDGAFAATNTLTAPGHGCSIGDVVIYKRAIPSERQIKFVVTNVSGNDITGTNTEMSESLITSYANGFITAVDKLRRRTRAGTDLGQAVNLPAQVVRDFYIVGVSPGISAQTDIPRQGPYTLENYLAAWVAPSTWFNVLATELKIVNGPLLMTEYTQARLDGIT